MKQGKILIVEDEAIIAHDLQRSLIKFGYSVLDPVASGMESISKIREEKPDVVLMDIVLEGNMDGIEAAEIIQNEYNIPVIFITTHTDDEIVERAKQQNPYAFLLKPFRGKELQIAIEMTQQRHAMELNQKKKNRELENRILEQKKTEMMLRKLSLFDDLTGIYNRRGFYTLMKQQVEIARRTGRELMLFFLDVDGLKTINDFYGHTEGDRALNSAVGILKNVFRSSDILARWGGDEFAVLMVNAEHSCADSIENRLKDQICAFNKEKDVTYDVSMSWGAVTCDPDDVSSIDEVLSDADKLMYRHKETRKKVAGEIPSSSCQ